MIYRIQNKWLFLLLPCIPVNTLALSSDRQQSIFIEAEAVEIDKQQGVSRYEGNVRFKQGSLIIRGGTVHLYHKNGELHRAIIRGYPASFQQTPDKGGISIISQAKEMEYVANSSRLFLYQNARVSQGKNIFSGEKIEYDIIKGTVVANKGLNGNNRINAILETEPPETKP
ncbi:MAG: lipopolysaccharide transport periplasmic protein LptA [Gammaproteobacteria bacterium]|nr:lipopolysaccharide transport periplasmic protein LptA [Gammaproteobacteria bacterium]